MRERHTDILIVGGGLGGIAGALAALRLGRSVIRERYGNLFQMYHEITGENAYKRPMRIYPAVHYTMGGLWVDYNLMTTVPGLCARGRSGLWCAA